MSDAPTDPKKLTQLKAAIEEMTHAYRRMDDEKELCKEIAKALSEEFSIKTAMINKIAKTMYKTNYATVQQENEDFETLYEAVIEAKSTPSLSAVSND